MNHYCTSAKPASPLVQVMHQFALEWRVGYLSSASFIQRSSTGLIFWALLGVMSSFSNLKREDSSSESRRRRPAHQANAN